MLVVFLFLFFFGGREVGRIVFFGSVILGFLFDFVCFKQYLLSESYAAYSELLSNLQYRCSGVSKIPFVVACAAFVLSLVHFPGWSSSKIRSPGGAGGNLVLKLKLSVLLSWMFFALYSTRFFCYIPGAIGGFFFFSSFLQGN